ncbi:MAG: aminotransferase class V-fold PLP-dependent enzyme [Chloroflexota bacterium]|nr:aminotransferase class V-fold PLP-dependent enzyme [Chloroflexota bacterium]
MEGLLRDTAGRATRYLAGLDDRPVGPTPEAIRRLSELAGPFPDQPMDPAAVVALLDEIGSPATVASAGGRYFGFVTGGSLPAALAANWLAGAWDQNCAFAAMSPLVAALEEITLDWLRDALHLPTGCGGGFVTGATVANFTALAAARHAVLARVGWDVEADGLFGAPPITVVVGTEVHASLVKALGLVGFGRNRVVTVPVDGQGRMRADALPPLAGPTIVCIQAGNVNTGAFDPAAAICAAAHDAGAWVHVDGAFGLWAAVAPDRAHLVEGFAEADSWATDAHKWLNVPYDSGLAFVRDPEALRAAMTLNAAYLQQSGGREPNHYTPEASRRARAVDIWAALRSLGRSGLADLIERNCRYASQMADGLRVAGYDVLNDVELNQVLVSFGDTETTRRIVAAVQAEGTCWCGSTVWQGQTAMRISVSSWATTNTDIERSLAAILHIAGKD